MIDLAFHNNLAPQKGRVLISDPFQGDEYFERSVVYLCEHTEESSFGFVISQPIRIGIDGLSEEFKNKTITAYRGGPCNENTLYFLHTLGDRISGSDLIDNGIYIGSNYKDLYEKMTPELISEGAIKLFLGYSGWSAGQLEEEIAKNAWVVAEVEDIERIMLSHKDVWKHFMSKLGKKYEVMTQFPLNPSYN